MAVFEFIRSFSPATLLQGSRSTVLNALGWMAALLISGLIGGSIAKIPDWIVQMFGYAFASDFCLFLIAFVYFGITDKDALRSETFGIQKLAIERGMIGDSKSGVFASEESLPVAEQDRNIQILTATKQIEQDK